MKSQAELLFEEYQRVRPSNLSLGQFTYIMNVYPSLLVCMSDGALDKEEWQGVNRIAQGLALEFAETAGSSVEALEQTFKTEFRYLAENAPRWKKKFLNALKLQIQDSLTDKEFILESMYLFANAADGISQMEQETIYEISDKLALEH